MSSIAISEIFGPTIQGEGALIGTPTVFVRTGGCDFHCHWCDTLYAVEKRYRDQWSRMSAQQVLAKIEALSGGTPLLVTLSGGNPALQPLAALIALGVERGYRFALETQGSVSQTWFSALDVLTLSPKPPSSGMVFSAEKLHDCITAAGDKTAVNLKIVIDDANDLHWAGQRHSEYPHLPLTLQPCNTHSGNAPVDKKQLNEKMRWLVATVNERQWYGVRVLPQLHVQLWGNQRGF